MVVSVPAKLEQKYLKSSDSGYIELALEEGITTRRNRTGGFGLYYTFDLLKRNSGTMVIASRRSAMRGYFKSRKFKFHILKEPLFGTWCFNRFKLQGD
ncbi:MAG: hypothetical protein JXA66_09425 [Oligoflexia bacterium]|nr:hypothetical protein [Oligoflexia bacterium]